MHVWCGAAARRTAVLISVPDVQTRPTRASAAGSVFCDATMTAARSTANAAGWAGEQFSSSEAACCQVPRRLLGCMCSPASLAEVVFCSQLP